MCVHTFLRHLHEKGKTHTLNALFVVKTAGPFIRALSGRKNNGGLESWKEKGLEEWRNVACTKPSSFLVLVFVFVLWPPPVPSRPSHTLTLFSHSACTVGLHALITLGLLPAHSECTSLWAPSSVRHRLIGSSKHLIKPMMMALRNYCSKSFVDEQLVLQRLQRSMYDTRFGSLLAPHGSLESLGCWCWLLVLVLGCWLGGCVWGNPG